VRNSSWMVKFLITLFTIHNKP